MQVIESPDAPSATVRKSGRMEYATAETAKYKDISAENVDTGSAKHPSTILTHLKANVVPEYVKFFTVPDGMIRLLCFPFATLGDFFSFKKSGMLRVNRLLQSFTVKRV